MTNALISGRQVNNIYVVNVNEVFAVAVMPIDRVTKLRLAQIQWGTWRWLANVTMYTLPSFNRVASLVANNSSRTVINLVAGTVSVTGLSLNGTGMYVLQIRLTSSNNEHDFTITSTGILAKDPKGIYQ